MISMQDRVFVDTKILVYARDSSDPVKQKISSERIRRLWEDRTGRISIQVSNEYYVTVTRKLNPGQVYGGVRVENPFADKHVI